MSGFMVVVDGREAVAHEGDTVGAVLRREQVLSWPASRDGDAPRTMFCGMGACQGCLVTVDGVQGVRACLAPAVAGSTILTGRSVGAVDD